MIPEYEKMCLNKFKKVHIPRNRDLFVRFGERASLSSIPDDAVFNSEPNRKMETFEAIKQESYRKYAEEQRRLAEAKEREASSNADTGSSGTSPE